ncbi:unnamed protein product [Adineta ricciae]|uniref:Uncharacterized protein n=1 Tax=Adineta ricciae TaxID=249248 RepID=A0A816H6D5_ADIRI|nr:unnamed protein product [Adineta ricciae]
MHQKKYREKLKAKSSNNPHSSTYKTRQSSGKALQRTLRSLPKDPQKPHDVVQHSAPQYNAIPKLIGDHKREHRA